MDKKTLLSYQPDYYKNSKVIDNLNTAFATELTKAQKNIINTFNQFFLLDADTSLSRWEKEFGIAVNENLSIDERRKRILGKLRGLGIENNEDYSFTIKLISSVGFKKIIIDLLEILEEIKPAHLRINLQMDSLTNDNLIFKTTMLCGEEIHVFPYQITNIKSKGKLHIALGNTQNAEIISVNPRRN